MSQERTQNLVKKLIQDRLASIGRTYPIGEKLREFPEVVLPGLIDVFFESPSLWLKVGEDRFTPSLLIKAFFVLENDEDDSGNKFSVFIADCKRHIADRWGINPKSAGNKQRNQFWDEEYIRTLFTYVVFCKQSKKKNENKLAYKIRDNMEFEEMEVWFAQGINEVVDRKK